MVVGITRLTLAIPGASSLKDKRSVVKKLLDRVRARFHVSAAEVDLQDVHGNAVLGFVTVGTEARRVKPVLERVVAFVDSAGLAQILSVEHDTLTWGVEIGGEAWKSYAEKFGTDESWPPAGAEPIRPVEGERKIRIEPGSLGLGSRKDEESE